MARPLTQRQRQWRVLGVIVTGAVALGAVLLITNMNRAPAAPADPTQLDDTGRVACQTLITGFKSATTHSARVELANKTAAAASKSGTNGIAAAAGALGVGADGSTSAWQLAADIFSQACIDGGWPTKG